MRPRATDYESVINAASRCIAAGGIQHTTVDHVADAAGVSRATVYRHAGGKRTLVRAVLQREIDEIATSAAEAARTARTPSEAVHAVARVAMAAVGTSPVLQRLTGPDLESNLPLFTTGLPDLIRGVIEAAQRSPGAAPADAVAAVAEDLARFLVMMVHTPTLAADNRDPDAVAARAVRVFGPLVDRSLAAPT